MRPRRHVEIHIAGGIALFVAHHIPVAVVDDALDQIDHVEHMAGGPRLHGGCEHAQRLIGVGEFALVIVGARPPLLAGRGRLVEDFVVDIGHIAHECDVITKLGEPTAHDVERHRGADMADMRA